MSRVEEEWNDHGQTKRSSRGPCKNGNFDCDKPVIARELMTPVVVVEVGLLLLGME